MSPPLTPATPSSQTGWSGIVLSQNGIPPLPLLALLIWAFLLGCTPIHDFDVYWHLKTGQEILTRGSVPYADWYTYTNQEALWIDLHWLHQVLLAGIHSLGGFNGLILFKAITLTGAVAIGWHASGRGLPVWLRTLLWVPAVICIAGRASERPESISLICLAIWLWLIGRLQLLNDQVPLKEVNEPVRTRANNEPGQGPRYWMLWLPLMQLVWTNCHALFILGWVVGGAFFLEKLFLEFRSQNSLETSNLSSIQLFRIGLVCILVSFLNPYFEQGVLFPITLFRKFSMDRATYATIGEFTPLWVFWNKPGAFEEIHFLSQILLAVITAASFLLLGRQQRLSRLLIIVAFGYLALQATRNVNLFAMTFAWALSGNLADVYLRKTKPSLNQNPQGIKNGHWPSLLVGGMLALFSILFVTGGWNQLTGETKKFGFGEREDWPAHGACAFLSQKELPDLVFAGHLGQAAVLIYHASPPKLVFMDPRLEVSSVETYQSLELIMNRMRKLGALNIKSAPNSGNPAELDWQTPLLQASSGVPPVVFLDLNYNLPEVCGVLFTPGWIPVYVDRVAFVFLHESVASRLKLEKVPDEEVIQALKHHRVEIQRAPPNPTQ